MLTSCASNVNGGTFPYNPSASGTCYRYNLGQGRSYNPKKSTSNFLDVSGNGINGTAYSISNQYYPWKYGGMIYLNNTTGYNPTPGNGLTVVINNATANTTNNFTAIVAWEYVASNLTYGADIIAGAYNGGSDDWWLGQSGYSATAPYQFSISGNGYSLGGAPVAGRRYIAIIANSFTALNAYYYLFDSAGNSYSNTAIPFDTTAASGYPALGKYGGWDDNYMPRCYFGDFLWWPSTYLSTTQALAVKDKIKYRYGITV